MHAACIRAALAANIRQSAFADCTGGRIYLPMAYERWVTLGAENCMKRDEEGAQSAHPTSWLRAPPHCPAYAVASPLTIFHAPRLHHAVLTGVKDPLPAYGI